MLPSASYGGNVINAMALAALLLPRDHGGVETPNQRPYITGQLKQSHRLPMFHVRKMTPCLLMLL